jgi:hypothetical protein
MHPPLDATFFQRVAKWRRRAYFDDGGASLYDRVARQAAALGVDDLARISDPISLEEHLGRLYFNVHHDPRITGVRDYFTLVDLYAREVIGTTDWMIGKRRRDTTESCFAGCSSVTFSWKPCCDRHVQH